MKTKKLLPVLMIMLLASCTSINKSMREPNTRVELTKSDFSLSNQVSGEARCTKVLGIDFKRLFKRKSGEISTGSMHLSSVSIPVVGNYVQDKTANYSLYELMSANPGYDVIFYPQYDTKTVKPILGLGFLLKITAVKTTARLGKLNN